MTKPLVERYGFIMLLGGLSALTALTIDITAPATGVIARDLSVDESLGSMIVGIYFLAYGVGQLFWGLLSDAYGRKKVLLVSLALFAAASIGTAMATDFWTLIAFRAAQGLFAGAPVIARAMVRDVGSGIVAAKLLAVLMAVTAIAPMLAPIMGAGLMVLFSWRAIFVFLALFGLVLLLLSGFNVPETLKETRPERFSIRFLVKAFNYLFRQRDFLVGMGVSSLTFGGYASILSLGAVVVEETYDLPPSAFGAIFAIGAIFILGGTITVRVLVGRIGLRNIGVLAVSILGVATITHGVLFFMEPSLGVFWGAVCIYMLAFGLILPSAQAVAMEPAGDMPGFASSVLGSMLMLAGALGAVLAGALLNDSHTAVSGTMAIFGTGAVAVFIAARIYDRRKG
ncbi:MAG: multidrug effflux MFS transporter [Paracoccaceae bacterium]